MFLSEMVRHVGEESNLINDDTTYSTSGDGAWEEMNDYGNITPTSAGIYVLSFAVQYATNPAWFRLKIGDRWVFGKALTDAWVTHTLIVYLPTGTQAVVAQGWGETGTPDGVAQIKDFQMGLVAFSDTDGESLQTYSSGLTMNITSRKTPAGPTNKATLVITCFAYTSGADTNFENIGDDETNGVSLSFEGSQVDWTTRNHDTDSKENASAEYIGSEDLNEDIAIAITKDNANTVVHISVVYTPWILNSETDYEPITLDFTQGSTLYILTEPLTLNPTVNIKIGKVRAITFGDATDYYSTDSGTGILDHSYTFEEVKPDQVSVFIYGSKACISSIGVDIR